MPSWLLGTGWKKRLGPWRAQCSALFDVPFKAAQKVVVSPSVFAQFLIRPYPWQHQMRGKAKPSIASDPLEYLQTKGEDPERKENITKDIAGTAF